MNENKSAAVLPDFINLRLLAKPVVGPTGHRVYFIGHHYDGKQECYDVGSARMDVRPIQVTRRHHHEKHEALITWDKLLAQLKEIEERPRENRGEQTIVVVPRSNKVQ